MGGHEVRTENLQRERPIGEEILRGENMSLKRCYKDINFSIRAGEIVGFTGLLGDGRSELFRSIFGGTTDYRGQVYLEGKKIKAKNPEEALKLGIGYLPRDRK